MITYYYTCYSCKTESPPIVGFNEPTLPSGWVKIVTQTGYTTHLCPPCYLNVGT